MLFKYYVKVIAIETKHEILQNVVVTHSKANTLDGIDMLSSIIIIQMFCERLPQ